MADRDTLPSLAERCEKAEGRDRELDVAIHAAFGDDQRRRAIQQIGPFGPHYTASIDAALSLVPADRYVGALSQNDSGSEWYARIECHHAVYEDALAATPALALTAAALRAHAALNTDNGGPDGS